MRRTLWLCCCFTALPCLAAVRTDLLVTPAWLAEHLEDPAVVVIQVAGSEPDYAKGHLAGAGLLLYSAVYAPRDGLPGELPAAADLLPPLQRAGARDDARIVLYEAGAGEMATRAYVALDYLGHGDHAAILDGGLAAWRAVGLPVATGPAATKEGHLTPRLRPSVLVDRRVVADASWAITTGAGGLHLIDSRSREEYTGARAGGGIPRGGHIPGAKWLDWTETIEDPLLPRFKPLSTLQQLHADLGIGEADTVIAYCRSGARSSVEYFVAGYLGFEVRLYSGSFADWSRQPDLPVATGEQP